MSPAARKQYFAETRGKLPQQIIEVERATNIASNDTENVNRISASQNESTKSAESDVRPVTSLSGSSSSSTLQSMRKRQSADAARTTYQYNDWVAPTTEADGVRKSLRSMSARGNRESSDFAIGFPLSQSTAGARKLETASNSSSIETPRSVASAGNSRDGKSIASSANHLKYSDYKNARGPFANTRSTASVDTLGSTKDNSRKIDEAFWIDEPVLPYPFSDWRISNIEFSPASVLSPAGKPTILNDETSSKIR